MDFELRVLSKCSIADTTGVDFVLLMCLQVLCQMTLQGAFANATSKRFNILMIAIDVFLKRIDAEKRLYGRIKDLVR